MFSYRLSWASYPLALKNHVGISNSNQSATNSNQSAEHFYSFSKNNIRMDYDEYSINNKQHRTIRAWTIVRVVMNVLFHYWLHTVKIYVQLNIYLSAKWETIYILYKTIFENVIKSKDADTKTRSHCYISRVHLYVRRVTVDTFSFSFHWQKSVVGSPCKVIQMSARESQKILC